MAIGSPIQNGNASGLTTGTLPNMGDALLSYFQPMTFTQIVKTVVNFNVVETPTEVSFYGVWQPWQPQNLDIVPIGQRAWTWFQLHADPTVDLKPDDVVYYKDVQYRVKAKLDYIPYGYNEYRLIQDYQGVLGG